MPRRVCEATGQGTCSQTPTSKPHLPKHSRIIESLILHSQARPRHCSVHPRVPGPWSYFCKWSAYILGSPIVPQVPRPHPCHDLPACFESELPVSLRHNCSRSSASCKERKQHSPKGPSQSLQGMIYQDSPKMPSTTLHA